MFQTSDVIHPLCVKVKDKPQKFTYPFNYTPHSWVQQAAKEVQQYLEQTNDIDYNFGFDCSQSVGKMFGVLVVEIKPNQFGYLAAFSGKIQDANHLEGFVPPIFDLLDPDNFFKKGESELNILNQTIMDLEQSEELLRLNKNLLDLKNSTQKNLKKLKRLQKEAKKQRAIQRKNLDLIEDEKYKQDLLSKLNNESIHHHYEIKKFKKLAHKRLLEAEEQIKRFTHNIQELKLQRKNKSAELQRKLHQSYSFLNANNIEANLLDVFLPFNRIPPAGAGECAAPRLLNYAYQTNLHPIAMGEFWWGALPKSEIREHKNFYPACKSKCEPILRHMLQGLDVEQNPVQQAQKSQPLDIIYEDDAILVVNKPNGLLSVPGKSLQVCLEKQVKAYLSDTDSPMLVHRLDMATSGVVLIAKNLELYKILQKQFMQRTVNKSYTALLDGIVSMDKGTIDLPLRVDLDNRPMQLVCYEHGKAAVTHYQVVERNFTDELTRIKFYPITGRTHQLRVHAAHHLGLHSPIKGDDLYGKRQDRLYLHATTLEFSHPVTNERSKFKSEVPF